MVVEAIYGVGFASAFISRGHPSLPAWPTRGPSVIRVLSGFGTNPPTQNLLTFSYLFFLILNNFSHF